MSERNSEVGQRAECKSVNPGSNLNSSILNVSKYMGYVPFGWKKSTSTSPSTPAEREPIQTCSFDQYEINNQIRRCVILTYQIGVQIWDIEDPANVHEIYSNHTTDSPIKVMILPTPTDEANDELAPQRPIIAILHPNAENRTGTIPPRGDCVVFYSLRTHTVIRSQNISKFKCVGLLCNRSVICLLFENMVGILSATTLKQIGRIKPSITIPLRPEIVALGERWIALPSSNDLPEEQTELGVMAFDVAREVGAHINTGIRYAGNWTAGTIYNYWYGEAPAPEQPEKKNPPELRALSIDLYDLYNLPSDPSDPATPFCSFRPHKDSFSFLKFDPSGALLTSVSQDGCHLHVFQIVPEHSKKPNSHPQRFKAKAQLLYALRRGVTSAQICDISFSSDSHWLSVCSSRGTVHLFGIHPRGGPVTILSHPLPDEPRTKEFTSVDAQYIPFENAPKPLFQEAANRIKNELPEMEGITLALNRVICCGFLPGRERKLLVLHQLGSLRQYEMRVDRLNETRDSPLKLDLVPECEWDVNRLTSWYQVSVPLEEKKLAAHEKQTNWTSFIEISTHSSSFQPLVSMRSLFHFKTYSENDPSLAMSILRGLDFSPVSAHPFSSPMNPNQRNSEDALKKVLNKKMQPKNFESQFSGFSSPAAAERNFYSSPRHKEQKNEERKNEEPIDDDDSESFHRENPILQPRRMSPTGGRDETRISFVRAPPQDAFFNDDQQPGFSLDSPGQGLNTDSFRRVPPFGLPPADDDDDDDIA